MLYILLLLIISAQGSDSFNEDGFVVEKNEAYNPIGLIDNAWKRVFIAILLLIIMHVVRMGTYGWGSKITMADATFVMGKFTVHNLMSAGFAPVAPENIIQEVNTKNYLNSFIILEKDGIVLKVMVHAVNADSLDKIQYNRVVRLYWLMDESTADSIKIGGFTIHRGAKNADLQNIYSRISELRATYYRVVKSSDSEGSDLLIKQEYDPVYSGWYRDCSIVIWIFLIVSFFNALGKPILHQMHKQGVSKPRKFLKEELKNMRRSAGPPLAPFRLEQSLMKSINKHENLETNIRTLMFSIMRQMGIPGNSLELFIVYSPFDSFAGFMHSGRYQYYPDKKSEIELFLKTDYNAWNIAAILAHECAHHWIMLNNLYISDSRILEYRTDIATIYTGFGKIIRKGYAEKTKALFGLVMRVRFGYLTKADFNWVASHKHGFRS